MNTTPPNVNSQSQGVNSTAKRNQPQSTATNSSQPTAAGGNTFITKERVLIDDIVANSKVFIDQHKQYQIIYTSNSGRKQSCGVESEAFQVLCGRMLHERNPEIAITKRIKEECTQGLICALDEENYQGRVTKAKTAIRNLQTGTVDDGAIKLCLDLSNNAGEVIQITPGKWEVLSECVDVFFLEGDNAAEIMVPPHIAMADVHAGLDKLWDNNLVPADMRMAFLGQMINNFFTEDSQPMAVFYSPDPGQTGKTPTAYYARQILDPQTERINVFPSTKDAIIRTMGANRVVALDEATINNFCHSIQKRFDAYTMNGIEKIKKLYSTVGLMTVDTSGLTILTTNTKNLLKDRTTQDRSVVYQFEEMAPGKAKVSSKALADFEYDLDEIRGTLYTLIAEVLRVLPTVPYGTGGHRFQMYSRIVDSLHQILGVPGSMAETLNHQAVVATATRDDDLLISDIGAVINKAGAIENVSASTLYKYLLELNKDNPVAIDVRSRSTNYPGRSKDLLGLLRESGFRDQLLTGFIVLSVKFCKRKKGDVFTLESSDKSVTDELYADLASRLP